MNRGSVRQHRQCCADDKNANWHCYLRTTIMLARSRRWADMSAINSPMASSIKNEPSPNSNAASARAGVRTYTVRRKKACGRARTKERMPSPGKHWSSTENMTARVWQGRHRHLEARRQHPRQPSHGAKRHFQFGLDTSTPVDDKHHPLPSGFVVNINKLT